MASKLHQFGYTKANNSLNVELSKVFKIYGIHLKANKKVLIETVEIEMHSISVAS